MAVTVHQPLSFFFYLFLSLPLLSSHPADMMKVMWRLKTMELMEYDIDRSEVE